MTSFEEQQIVEKYLAGQSCEALERELGISDHRIKKVLNKLGIPIRCRRFSQEDVNEMIRLYYEENLSSIKIGKIFNTSSGVVRVKVASSGRKLYKLSERTKDLMMHEGIMQNLWTKLIHSAKARSIPFELSIEEGWELFVKQERKCAISGLELTFPKNQEEYKRGKYTASLDRIDSSIPYIITNVQWISKVINLSKWDYDEKIFLELCRSVADYAKRPD